MSAIETSPNGRDEHPAIRWVLLTGDRRVAATALSLAFAGSAGALIALDIIYVGPGSNLSTTLSSGLLSGLLTLLTVALSINLLILSRLFGSVGGLADELEGTLAYRRRVEDIADRGASPHRPREFIGLLGETLEDRVHDFQGELSGRGDGADLNTYASNIQKYASRLGSASEIDRPFTILLLTLGTEYADLLEATRDIRRTRGEEFSEHARASLDQIHEVLKAITTMRMFFKTLLLQQELAALSRQLIYTGVPAILVTYLLSVVYTADPAVALSLNPGYLPILFVIATGIMLSPLAVLVVYLLRIATVSLYTVSIGTFIPPQRTFE